MLCRNESNKGEAKHMSVKSEIDRIKGNISDAYEAAEEKGATIPTAENSANLPRTIMSIPNGEIQDGSVTTAKLADSAVTAAKIAEGVIPSKTSDLTNDSGFAAKDEIEPAIDRSDNIFYFTNTASRTVGGLTLEFLSKSSVRINGTPAGYVYLGIMGGTGDKVGTVVNSADSFSGTYSVRINQSDGTGTSLRYGALKAAGTNFADGATVSIEDQYFSLRILPNQTYTDYIVEVMLTPTEAPKAFIPYDEVIGAVDTIARSSLATPERFIELSNQVQPQKILTWIDDDTASDTAIQSVMDIADELGIRCTFASITGNWTAAIVNKLKEAQNKGFHIISHGHSSHTFWRTESLLTLDGDLALSLSELRQNGFIDSDMIAYPGGVVGRTDIDITKIARKWCRCGVQDYVAAGGKYFTGYGKGRYLINRKIIDKSAHADAAYYTDALDAFSDHDAPWYLFATHAAQSDQFDADLMKTILQYAMANGWTIMTLNEAYKYRERYYRIQEMFGLN